MEQRFGHDFSHVRVHSDASAAESARAVRARAYTVGEDIVFGRGQYRPATSGGKRLLAHELTHVLQQSHGSRMVLQRDEDVTDLEVLHLNEHVANNPRPFKYIIGKIRSLRERELDDDLAAKFTEQQSQAQLEAFAETPEGLEMLNVLYRAMTNGKPSPSDHKQSTRIMYAKWRWSGAELFKAEELSDPELNSVLDKTITVRARKLAVTLMQRIARKDYAGLLKEVRSVQMLGENAYIEDDIASRVTSLLSPQRLDELAADVKGREILDALYDALITGTATAFERLQTDRILDAKKRAVSPEEYDADAKSGKTLPLSDTIFGETATFTAKLRGGKVHVVYQSSGVKSKKFRNATKTLQGDLTREGLWLDPNDVVRVRSYDYDRDRLDRRDGEDTTILAIQLIEYAEQTQERFEGRAVTVVGTAATPFLAGLGGGAVKALAAEVAAGNASKVALAVSRLALWSDRVAFGVQVVTAVANHNRAWILGKFPNAGGPLLSVLEQANRYADFTGNVIMGIDAVRFLGSKLRPAWTKFRDAKPTKPLTEAERKALESLREQVDSTLHAADAGDAVARVNKDPGAFPVREKEGHRYTDLRDGHEIVEVRGKGPSGAGSGCEYHSNRRVVVPCTVNFQGASSTGNLGPSSPGTKRFAEKYSDALDAIPGARDKLAAIQTIADPKKRKRELAKFGKNLDELMLHPPGPVRHVDPADLPEKSRERPSMRERNKKLPERILPGRDAKLGPPRDYVEGEGEFISAHSEAPQFRDAERTVGNSKPEPGKASRTMQPSGGQLGSTKPDFEIRTANGVNAIEVKAATLANLSPNYDGWAAQLAQRIHAINAAEPGKVLKNHLYVDLRGASFPVDLANRAEIIRGKLAKIGRVGNTPAPAFDELYFILDTEIVRMGKSTP